jgi:hypothetical protein
MKDEQSACMKRKNLVSKLANKKIKKKEQE